MTNMYEIISKKRDGLHLSYQELQYIINEYTEGRIPDYQMSALLMAIYLRDMTEKELISLTDIIIKSGQIVNLDHLKGKKVDKHSTGGVGDKVSIILAPIVAAAGVYVPMISGRSLGHTGGTLDKLESIPGFRVDYSIKDFIHILRKTGACLIGQTAELAPADKKLYALRDVTATVQSIPLIAASIMSKKIAEGIDGLVLDVKTGSLAMHADIYFVLEDPSGTLYYGDGWRWETRSDPALRNIFLPGNIDIEDARILTFEVPDYSPPIRSTGDYTFYFYATYPGTSDFISNVSSVSFTIEEL